MPLSHLQNQERQRARRRGESVPDDPEPPAAEEQPIGFDTTFAPLPTEPMPEAEIQAPPEPPRFPASAQLAFTPRTVTSRPPSGPTENVRMLHQVGQYAAGSVVPASCFGDIQRLLNLEAIEYTNELISDVAQAAAMQTAMGGAQPVATTPQGMPHAPWHQASVRDILGPALPREAALPPQAGYSQVRTEWGNTMVVADRQ